jgi:hypothetical protein
MVRFKLDEILNWARQRTVEMEGKDQAAPRITPLSTIQTVLTQMM